MSDLVTVVPFGKYKGRPVEELLEDSGYLQWLTGQDWFRTKFVSLHQTIINRGAEPEETPAHNALQVRFLDDEFCRRFLRRAVRDFDAKVKRDLNAAREADLKLITEKIVSIELALTKKGEPRPGPYVELDRADRDRQTAMLARLRDMQKVFSVPIERAQFPIEGRRFEERGVDVVLRMAVCSKAHALPDDLPRATFVSDSMFGGMCMWREVRESWHFAIEIKPAVGDDYPAVLRQMKTNGSTILFLEQYTGTGATRDQFIRTFATASMQVIFAEDVEQARLT